MFVLNPDPYCLPSYRISPFTTDDIALNEGLPSGDQVDAFFADRSPAARIIYTRNGREALNIALAFYQLQKDDVVTIFTTSGNFYISSCVTKEIEKFCKWSRQIEDSSKVIIANHEFGFPVSNLEDFKKYGLPIIEDCAHSFYSQDPEKRIGTVGDFVVYSAPKIFPIQVGGILKVNVNGYVSEYKEDEALKEYVKKVMSNYVAHRETVIRKRVANFTYLETRFGALGFEPRFELGVDIVPGVFIFKCKEPHVNLELMKDHFYAHGIQCSIFYGERAFFIPCHQALETLDLDYFVAVMQHFISKPD